VKNHGSEKKDPREEERVDTAWQEEREVDCRGSNRKNETLPPRSHFERLLES
jgi:hypothetical protein